MYQSSIYAHNLAPLSRVCWVWVSMYREMGSTAAAKPQGDSGQPCSIPLLQGATAAAKPHGESGHPSGLDACVGTIIVHALGSGACVPSGEDRGQIGVVLSEAVQHVASGDIPKGCLQVQRDQDTGLVRLRKVLYEFDQLVGAVLAAHSVLEWAGCIYD